MATVTPEVIVDPAEVIGRGELSTVSDSDEGNFSLSDSPFDGDCDDGAVKANLNFFRCLFACFNCSFLACARRRRTTESAEFSLGFEISFVHLILSSSE